MQQLDLTGRWKFSENFDFGVDTGYAELKQDGDSISGYMHFSEQTEGDATFVVRQEIEGVVNGDNIKFRATSYEIMWAIEEIPYELDEWEGTITSEGKIVGSSQDEEGTCGVFVMEREPVTEKITE